jgi:hypothetical protein
MTSRNLTIDDETYRITPKGWEVTMETFPASRAFIGWVRDADGWVVDAAVLDRSKPQNQGMVLGYPFDATGGDCYSDWMKSHRPDFKPQGGLLGINPSTLNPDGTLAVIIAYLKPAPAPLMTNLALVRVLREFAQIEEMDSARRMLMTFDAQTEAKAMGERRGERVIPSTRGKRA